jgi:energy-coupling factor transporter ATP-binding protein EcfA2
MSTASAEELILERLSDAHLPDPVGNLIIASLLGDDDLAATVSSDGQIRPSAQPGSDTANEPTATYLRGIAVEGFRGIGPQVTLRLNPGPGLTLVAGRNGSGKSSFAEAAELALTGDNKRWAGRTVIWRAGWRNLHTSGDSRIAVGLAADGQRGVTSIVREWPCDAALESGTAFAQAPGGPRQPIETLGLTVPLELYRPFLSYSELGTLVAGRPSEMYDALQAILGLDQLIDAERRLTDARKKFDESSKQARQALPDLLEQLSAHPDDRARQAEAALRRRTPDLGAIEALAVGDQRSDDGLSDRLQQVTLLTLPHSGAVTEAVQLLSAAERKVATLAGTPAADARRLASLLTTALNHYADHPGEPCPVCASRPLDDSWASNARTEITRLSETARDADTAHEEVKAASRALRTIVLAEPAPLVSDLGGKADTTVARDLWRQWAELAAQASNQRLCAEAAQVLAGLASAVGQVQADAARALQQRSDAWQPAAAALAGWAELARASQRAATMLAHLKSALTWLKATGRDIRNARLAPFAEMSARVWETLRQESNVELGPIRLEGSATVRHVSLDVTVDGVKGAALGVMSQGELHALGLALFLPRATAAASPFRFLVIDDPVQSMDPAKVDGLAHLLSQVAADRQVIVFTHDDRLPEALRRLQLPATVWEVVRRERSVVELRRNDDPVRRYLDDARALARTTELPEGARAIVVAGFCRSALEAACHEVIRARRIAAGTRHAEVEQAIASAHTLHQVVALALFDDDSRGEHVAARLRSKFGPNALSAFRAAKTGTHTTYAGDLTSFVEDTARLAAGLRQ